MKRIIKYTAILSVALPSLGQTLLAQGDASLIGSRVDPIRIAQNPAYISEEKVVLGLGLSSLSAKIQSPLSLSDLVTKTSEGKSKLYIDEALARLGGKTASTEVNYNLFLLGVRSNAGFFTLGASLNTQTEGGADKQLTDLIATGNGLYRGNLVSTKGLMANTQAHFELALGYATDRLLASRKLSIGGRMKVLFGQANAQTSKGSLNFFTSEDGHEIGIEGYQQIRLRMPRVSYSYDALGLIDKLDISLLDDGSPRFTFSNLGFGLDLGARYKLDESLSLGLSVRDLGFIKWKDGHTLTLDRRGGNTLYFRGVDVSSVLTSNTDDDDSDKAGFEALGEEIKKHITVEEHTSYTTSLPLKLHAMADYQVLRWLSLSALMGVSRRGDNTRPDLGLAVNCMPTKGFGLHLSASSLHGSPINLGAGLVLGRRVQFHLAVDNLLMLDLKDTKYAQLSTGLNFRF